MLIENYTGNMGVCVTVSEISSAMYDNIIVKKKVIRSWHLQIFHSYYDTDRNCYISRRLLLCYYKAA